jgi:hypothetical protein
MFDCPTYDDLRELLVTYSMMTAEHWYSCSVLIRSRLPRLLTVGSYFLSILIQQADDRGRLSHMSRSCTSGYSGLGAMGCGLLSDRCCVWVLSTVTCNIVSCLQHHVHNIVSTTSCLHHRVLSTTSCLQHRVLSTTSCLQHRVYNIVSCLQHRVYNIVSTTPCPVYNIVSTTSCLQHRVLSTVTYNIVSCVL